MTDTYILESFANAGFFISNETAEKFAVYCDMLVSWNKKMNLTAVKDEKEIVSRHFIDSLLPLTSSYLTQNAVCADVGTGAGFPGVPLAIMRPDIKMTLIDSLQKRLTFLDAVLSETGTTNCETVHIRAEDAAKGKYREQFSLVFSRAVAKTSLLCEYCLPLVAPGGYMLALKSLTAKSELIEAEPVARRLGAVSTEIFGTDERNIIAIKKHGNE